MNTAARLVISSAVVSLLAACSQSERVREIDWAKAALARNPAYEILATDESAGVFTVRDTAGGGVHTLRLQDLIAAPLPPRAATAAPAAAPAAETPEHAAPDAAAEPMVAANHPADEAQATRAGGGEPLAEGPGYSITREAPTTRVML